MRPAVFPLMLVIAAIAGRVLRASDPRRLDLSRELASPSWQHPLGCGAGGVDLLALSTEALLRSMLLAFSVGVAALCVGTVAGTTAGFLGGRTSKRLAQLCDAVQAFPSFVLALALLTILRHPLRWHVALILGMTAWAPFARLALAEQRVVRGLAYVEAARALGASRTRILLRHALPASWGLARAQLAVSCSALLVADAALAFLGVGPADGVALGALIDQGVGVSLQAPHVLFSGAATLCLGSLALQALADPAKRRSPSTPSQPS